MKGKLNFLQVLGLILVVLSAGILLGSQWLANLHSTQAKALASEIKSNLPQITQGDPVNYSTPSMPVLQLPEGDFSCLIEVRSFGIILPVGSTWDGAGLSKYPRTFWGSAYDSSLILGGSSQNGQFDFCGKLDLGDEIRITDMTGAQFSYEVIRIDRRNQVDLDVLRDSESHLTLFVKDPNAGTYIIVRCSLAP